MIETKKQPMASFKDQTNASIEGHHSAEIAMDEDDDVLISSGDEYDGGQADDGSEASTPLLRPKEEVSQEDFQDASTVNGAEETSSSGNFLYAGVPK